MNEYQLQQILKKTPAKFIKERPAKGGGKWRYVTGGYITKCLNLMFGWDWDFEILDEKVLIEAGEVVVKGKLTVRSNGKTIVKTQYGNKDIVFKKDVVSKPLSIGNDLKSAATDALKKCAASLGIAQDVYAPEEFKEVIVEEANFKDLALMLSNCSDFDDYKMIWDSLTEQEQLTYKYLFDKLLKP
jgi:hypothetical protein